MNIVLEGAKNHVINAACADLFAVVATLEGEPAAFLVERETAKLSIQAGAPLPGGGLAGCGSLHLEGCSVATEAMIRPSGKQGLLEHLRIWENEVLVAGALGRMQAALAEAQAHAREHVTGGKPLIAYQEVAFKLAEMLTLTQTAQLMAYKTAWLTAAGDRESAVFNACTKVFCTEAAERVSSEALSILSARGLSADCPAQVSYQQVKYTQVAGTSNEIARVMIGDAEM
jgi:alkylation response protein AidB-like acyl-CoA dehydrogenase